MRPHLVSSFLGLLLALAACSSGTSPAQPPGGAAGFPAPGGSGGSGPDPSCDMDGDGVASSICGGEDCDDGDAAVFPGAIELCNGHDDTCDGATDEGCACSAGDLRSCAGVADAVRNVGACRDGWQRCTPEGTWSACAGEVRPTDEGVACDRIDQDCDGEVDNPSCDPCPGGGPEICGNGLDDDCDGHIDNVELCTLDCSDVNPSDPGAAALDCCFDAPPSTYAGNCAEGGGLPRCGSDERTCFDLDGDPGTSCIKDCQGDVCVCGRRNGMGNVVVVADCGFYTPCARIDCDGRTQQPCYAGAPGTLGVGVCHGGKHSCEGAPGERSWSSCEGQQLPGDEICGNGLDDDCDGVTDEMDGATGKPCRLRPDCQPGAPEICGNGLDDDCDGFSDEGCTAPSGGEQACWTGELLDRGIGICRDGKQVEMDGHWGPCEGQVLPAGEACGDGLDSDCNGLGSENVEEDPGCCVARPEICNGVDDDCDGLADEGVLSRCGTCGGNCSEWEMTDTLPCGVPGTTCANVAPFDLDPSAITLSPGPGRGTADKVFVTDRSGVSFNSKLIVIDAASGVASEPIDLGYYVYGLVAAADGTVWLSSYASASSGIVEHRDGLGRLICQADAGFVYGLGVDAAGDAWPVSTTASFTYEVRHVSGSQVQAGSPPTCRVFDLAPSDPDSVSLAVLGSAAPVEDPAHYLWLTGGFGGTAVQRLDLLAARPELETLDVDLGSASYSYSAVGSDGALYVSYPMRRLDPGGPFDGTGSPVQNLAAGGTVLGFGFAPDGTMWGLQWGFDAGLVHLGIPTGQQIGGAVKLNGTVSSYGLAVDGSGKVWVAVGTDILRYDPLTGTMDPILTGSFPSVYQGSTRAPLLEVGRRRGLFTHVVDGGGYSIKWHDLSWSANATTGSRVAVVARFSDTVAGLDSTGQICGPYDSAPADVSICSGGRRYARLEVSLSGYGQPSVGNLKLTWDRR